VLFLGDCLLVIPALRILGTRHGLIRRIQYCSLWGLVVSLALLSFVWQFHPTVSS
jgi:hypothetical protein